MAIGMSVLIDKTQKYKNYKTLKLKDVREDIITMEWFLLKIICHLVLVEPSGLINLDIWMDSLEMENQMDKLTGFIFWEKIKLKLGIMEFL